MTSGRTATRRRLPAAERRTQILSVAANLLQREGYSAVGMDDVGKAVGISGPALYRHFSSKAELATEIGLELLVPLLEGTTVAVEQGGHPHEVLDRLIDFTVKLTLARSPQLTVVMRHLWAVDDGHAERINEVQAKVAQLWAPIIAETHPQVDAGNMRLLVRAGAGLVLSLARHNSRLSHDELEHLISSTAACLLNVTLPPSLLVEAQGAAGGWRRSSRREEILDVSMALFRQRGYAGVSMADIGHEVGLSASSTYRHFENKQDLLTTAIERGGSRIISGMSEALSQATSAADALERLVASYVAICLDNADLITVAGSEYHNLPADAMQKRRERLKVFVEEWTHCLATTRPDLSQAHAATLVRATQGMVTEAVRSAAIIRRSTLPEDLRKLALAALHLGGSRPS